MREIPLRNRNRDIVYTDTKSLRYSKVIVLTDADCFAGTTPLLLQGIDGQTSIKSIESLSDSWTGGEGTTSVNYKVWTEKGWTKILSVSRKKTSKEMVRICTSNGCVTVTEDHPMLLENGDELKAHDVSLYSRLMHSFPEFDENKATAVISEEVAYLMGFHVIQYEMGLRTNDNPTRKVSISESILNAPRNVRESFLKGVNAGNLRREVVAGVNDVVAAQCLYYLYKSVGINVNVEYTRMGYDLSVSKEDFCPNTTKIIRLGKTYEYVYDIETENHHLQSGVGQLITHNCDTRRGNDF